MHPLSRWWMRRRHGAGEWGGLFAAAPDGEWVSLDLETTGMNPAKDHILSLAAVPVRDGRLRLSERFERRVHTARAFGIESIRHHRITPFVIHPGAKAADIRQREGAVVPIDAGMHARDTRIGDAQLR